MSVVCAACKTENRDSAKFCHGCAGKLPAFEATGPSALQAMNTWRPPDSPSRRRALESPEVLPAETAGFWVRVGLMVLACGIGLIAWYAYVTRRITPPTPMATAVAAPAPRVPEKAVLPPAPVAQPAVPLVSSLRPGELAVEPGPVPPVAALSPLPQQPALRPPSPKAAAAPRFAAADPRSGCGNLNFIAAARCEAAQCDKAQFARHPRCDAVREERRRDWARRNHTLGT